MAGFSEMAMAKRLETLNTTTQSIQTLSMWLLHHQKHNADNIVHLWLKVSSAIQFVWFLFSPFFFYFIEILMCNRFTSLLPSSNVINATYQPTLRIFWGGDGDGGGEGGGIGGGRRAALSLTTGFRRASQLICGRKFSDESLR